MYLGLEGGWMKTFVAKDLALKVKNWMKPEMPAAVRGPPSTPSASLSSN